MALRGVHSRGLFDLRRRFIFDLCDPSDPHRRFEPSPVGGWCFRGRRLQYIIELMTLGPGDRTSLTGRW